MKPTTAVRYCPCCWLPDPHRTERRAAKEEIRLALQEIDTMASKKRKGGNKNKDRYGR